MPVMRAKMKVNHIENFGSSETLAMSAVCKSDGYPEDGADENNTFATFTPTADLKISITNPALVGQFVEGECYYLDFTKAAT